MHMTRRRAGSILLLAAFALLAATSARADARFLGRWALDPAGCKFAGSTAETTPLVVTDTSVAWFPGYCTIKKSYLIGEGLYLQAQCLSDGKTRVMPIGLQLKGKKLHRHLGPDRCRRDAALPVG